MDHKEWISIVFGTVNALIFIASASIAYTVYRWNDHQKKKDRALDLYKSLMTTEFLLKSRLISQEYLLEDPRNETYKKYKGLSFEELDTRLRDKGTDKERADRFYLRAIPNFFGSVDMLHEKQYLLKDEKVFSRVYAWYWVNIIEERQIATNPMYRFHEWMSTEEDLRFTREEKKERLAQLGQVMA